MASHVCVITVWLANLYLSYNLHVLLAEMEMDGLTEAQIMTVLTSTGENEFFALTQVA